MATFNQVIFIGRVGKMPELHVTKEGTPYLRFSLAVDQGKDQTMWLNIVCWQELAERVDKLLFKGAPLFVQGRLQMRTYTDKKSQAERVAVDVVASIVQVLEKKRPQNEAHDLPDEVLPEA